MGFFANCVSRQHLDETGVPYDSGLLYCYTNGTTELHNMYADLALTQLMSNPLHLDSRGNCKVYWDGNPVRFELWNNGKLIETWVNVSGGSEGGGSVEQEAAIRAAADSALSDRIDAEEYLREAADTSLNTRINNISNKGILVINQQIRFG